MKILSLVYEFEQYQNGNKDYYKILLQGIDSPERRSKFLEKSKNETFKLIDEGKYLHKVSLYLHEGCQFTHKKSELIQF